MSNAEQAKYLGGILTKKADAKTELQARINATNPASRSLDVFWKQTNGLLKWKLLIFNAVCISKVVYGLETTIAKEATLHKLDTVQVKGLRKLCTYHRRLSTGRKLTKVCLTKSRKNIVLE